MTRCHPRLLGYAVLASALFAATSAMLGCAEPTAPTGPGGQARAKLPGYVYPEAPPLVDRKSAGSFLDRLGCERTILWVLNTSGGEEASRAAALAKARDALRGRNMRVVGLYAGPPTHWRPDVVAMLRQAGASFPCLVVAPPASPGIAAWLTGSPGRVEPGLYVLDRSQRIVARYGPQPDQVAAMLADLSEGRLAAASRPADGRSLRARLRLIELSSGRVIAQATADAADPATLARELAQQLASETKPTGTVAVLPIREVGASATAPAVGGSLAETLARCLLHHGWPSVSGAESSAATLGVLKVTALEIEFDPSRLAHEVAWEAILVGSVEHQSCPAR